MNRGFLEKDVKEVEDEQKVYRLKQTYTLTDKGEKLYEAYKIIQEIFLHMIFPLLVRTVTEYALEALSALAFEEYTQPLQIISFFHNL